MEGLPGTPLLIYSLPEETAIVNPSVNPAADSGCLVALMDSNHLLCDVVVQPAGSIETISVLPNPVIVEHVEPIRNAVISELLDGERDDLTDVQGNLVVSQKLVDVPVNVIASHSLLLQVGGSAGVDVRSHGDWLLNSSKCESDSDSYSDHVNEFKMVRDKPIAGTFRGEFWGRGGRRR
ncbi:hypothetical protein MA16_Dca011234 [Dendrobium catenatum]|uniref:Uncharacterized protein n=1 Tax=Dendrobium catenatum TaxID=906689 RepID=A0A2I0VW73_9ASPA|nr:hypothetical protein MA16_Dca011234 [Dendrobium catenatum]